MHPLDHDKFTERDRYDARARELLQRNNVEFLERSGAVAVPEMLRRPYLVYEDLIRKSAKSGSCALDVCCGSGLFSLIAAQTGAAVAACDIAEHNLALARRRAEHAGYDLTTFVADAERLPVADHSYDVVTCAGSLSYLEIDRFVAEVRRVLKPGGWFVCVDSLNHNPIYRFNRYVQFWRGQRTRSTLIRMPTLATLRTLETSFVSSETTFHGTISFMGPLLSPLLGSTRTAQLLDRVDSGPRSFKRWAFKFVFRGARDGS